MHTCIQLYGVEAWTLKQRVRNKIKVVVMWIYRRTSEISLSDRVSNQKVLKRIYKDQKVILYVK